MSEIMFRAGVRVRYKFSHRDTGIIIGPWRTQGGPGWYVQWDHDPNGPRSLPAYESNLEALESKSTISEAGQ